MDASPKPKRQARPPRRPSYHFAIGKLRDPMLHSVVRTTWFRQGRPVEVDQIEIFETPDAEAVFMYYVGQSLRQGADVSVLSPHTPEEFGITNAKPI
jgi:hypothetical protein